MPLPANLKINQNSIIVAWTFLYPFLQRRAQASAPLWDDRLVEVANRVLSNPAFLELLVQVFNREKPVQALEMEAPAGVSRDDARAFAGSYQFIEGFLRDTAASAHDATYLEPAAPCECADAATVLHTLNSSRMSGHSMEPDANTYVAEQQAQGQSQLASSPGAGEQEYTGAAVRPPDKWVGQNVPPIPVAPFGNMGAGYAGAPSSPAGSANPSFVPSQPVGLAQMQAEKMHTPIPDVVQGGVPMSAATPVPGSETPQYAPTDDMPDTVSVSQPSTAQNKEDAAKLAGTPVAVGAPAPYQGPVSPTAQTTTPTPAQQTAPYSAVPQVGQTQAQPLTAEQKAAQAVAQASTPSTTEQPSSSSPEQQTRASNAAQAASDKAAADKSWSEQKADKP